MVNISLYKKNIDTINNEDELLDYLIKWKNIVSSNRDKDFFVNWENATNYLKKYSEEIALLNSILDFEKEEQIDKLKKLLDKYKTINKINKVIPILVAVSDWKVDFQLWDEELNTKEYDFSTTEQCIEFLETTWFSKFLNTFKSIRDYIFGVKVWMDTNWRKNRSWTFNENIIEKILENKIKDNNIEIFYQTTFWKLLKENYKEKFDLLPAWYGRKKCDVIIKKWDKFINIEINHFWGWWSKQEIADAYRARNNDLKKIWIWFVWNTDWAGWHKKNNEENKLLQSIKDIDFITNIKMLKNTDLIYDILDYYL